MDKPKLIRIRQTVNSVQKIQILKTEIKEEDTTQHSCIIHEFAPLTHSGRGRAALGEGTHRVFQKGR